MTFKAMLKRTPVDTLYRKLQFRYGNHSQTDEVEILSRLTSETKPPKTFVEFGYHPSQFNCIGLARTYSGLLIDGDKEAVELTRRTLPRRIRAEQMFITRENLSVVRDHCRNNPLGVLSTDVDGNDYWFLSDLIDLRPTIISVEYNASFGLRPITVPYSPQFIRHKMHPSGLYHGASITALASLCERNGYTLAAVSSGGANAFFVRNDIFPNTLFRLEAAKAYRENTLRNIWNSSTATEQWDVIKDMPYEAV